MDVGASALYTDVREASDKDAHCDNEHIGTCFGRIVNLRSQVIQSVTAVDGCSTEECAEQAGLARSLLGRALHTLQDAFSHSNWLNMPARPWQTSDFYDQANIAALASRAWDFSRTFCKEDETTLVDLSAVTSGYHLSSITYEVAQYIGNYGVRTTTFGLVRTVWNSCLNSAPAGKCAHGPLLNPTCKKELADGTHVTVGGINKDRPTSSAGMLGYNPAMGAARAASIQFVQGILDELSSEEQRSFLTGCAQKALHFVIDTTGSMASQIASVVSSIRTSVTALRPERMSLTTFNDPSVGSPQVTTDLDTFLAWLDELVGSVDGGGDCAELAGQGLLNALPVVRSGESVWVFTDAPAKDPDVLAVAQRDAQARRIQVTFALLPGCASKKRGVSVDGNYDAFAQATGGQAWYFGNADDLERAFQMSWPIALSNNAVLLLAVPSASIEPDECVDVDVSVDSSVDALRLALTSEAALDVSLLRPDNSLVEPSGASDMNVLSTSDVVVVYASKIGVEPAQGEWTLRVCNTHAFSVLFTVRVDGTSDIVVTECSVGPYEGRAADEALVVNTPGSLVQNTIVGFSAWVVGDVSARTSLELIDSATSDPFAPSTLVVSADVGFTAFEGSLIVPSAPFVMRVRGQNADGQPFVRQCASVYAPASLYVVSIVGHALRHVESMTTPLTLRFGVLLSPFGVEGIYTLSVTFDGGNTDAFELAAPLPPSTVTLLMTNETTFIDVNIVASASASFADDTNTIQPTQLTLSLTKDDDGTVTAFDQVPIQIACSENGSCSVLTGAAAGAEAPVIQYVTRTLSESNNEMPVPSSQSVDLSLAPLPSRSAQPQASVSRSVAPSPAPVSPTKPVEDSANIHDDAWFDSTRARHASFALIITAVGLCLLFVLAMMTLLYVVGRARKVGGSGGGASASSSGIPLTSA